MEDWLKIVIAAMGIPSAIMGLLIWWLKRTIDKRDAERDQKDKNTELFMLYIMRTSRATNVLAEATARAVQRIPDAHCNGDMTEALKTAQKIQNDEKEFVFEQGIKHIFE